MKEPQSSLKQILQPYITIAIAGLLAFTPVSFMLRALKNDVIALEYPINHFMSQSIHNGQIPYWFNTWGMGFPLQSNLTWGIFSTPQMLFCSLFNYNIYILHIEFMFFVLLAGWSMFHLLSKYVVKDKTIAQLLAISYMLSGFVVGSTQWLLYITAASFIPLVISSLLKLLYIPSFKNALQFAILYSLMFTSVYAAFNIITTYGLVIFILIWFLQSRNKWNSNVLLIKHLLLAGLFTALLCLPCLYYTTELLKNIERGSSINSDVTFFNSNYLHPAALSSMLLPFSSVKMSFSNTEGTMLDTYAGLFCVLSIPLSVWLMVKEKNKSAILLLFTALLFLLISFGEMTPLRTLLNRMPGFSYFRNPAIFRLYFLLSLLLFIAVILKNRSFKEICNFKQIHYSVWALSGIYAIVFLLNFIDKKNSSANSMSAFIKNINFNQTILVSCLVQIFILIAFYIFARAEKFGIVKLLLITDLIINTLICTPFFSVSSYSIPEVSNILHSIPNFPVQNEKPGEVPATYTDSRNNVWNNVNVFKKKVSTGETYRGPLTLNNYYASPRDYIQEQNWKNSNFVFSNDSSASIQLVLQQPTHIQALLKLRESTIITVMQNNYRGWKAFYNNKETEITPAEKKGLSIIAPAGNGILDLKYERKSVWIYALLLHLITISFMITKLFSFCKKITFKSSSLS